MIRGTSPASDESELPVGKPERERELYLDTDSVDQLHLADATATQMVQAGGRVPF